jgi:hypothetical protein
LGFGFHFTQIGDDDLYKKRAKKEKRVEALTCANVNSLPVHTRRKKKLACLIYW